MIEDNTHWIIFINIVVIYFETLQSFIIQTVRIVISLLFLGGLIRPIWKSYYYIGFVKTSTKCAGCGKFLGLQGNSGVNVETFNSTIEFSDVVGLSLFTKQSIFKSVNLFNNNYRHQKLNVHGCRLLKCLPVGWEESLLLT